MSDTLKTVFPDQIEYAGRRLTVGAKSKRLLAEVLASGGAARVGDLAIRVWGKQRVRRTCLADMLSRLNRKLEAARCPLRLTRDGGRVLLL